MSDPLLPDLRDAPKDEHAASEPNEVPDTPVTDPDRSGSAQATGEDQAEHNRQTENPT